MTKSCFAARIGKHLRLTPAEERALERLEENPRPVRRGQVIQREHEVVKELFVLSRGRLMSYVILPDGQRQILRVHFPGDFVGAASTVYGRAPESLVAVTDGEVCPFDKHALRELLQEHPRVAALMFVISQTERVSLNDRLASVGRSSAKSRLAAFLLDMFDRLRLMDEKLVDRFDLRLTQEEIGDALGLTSVHVNRMFRQLEEEGLISRENGAIIIREEQQLRQAGHYVNRYRELDVDWFPNG